MNKIQAILLFIAVMTLPLITLFIPDEQEEGPASLEGVTLQNMQGQNFRFSLQLSEKPVLFVFWSVTCGSCIEEIPFLINMHQKHKNELTIMGIHPPGHPQVIINRFLKTYPEQIPYMLAIDTESKLIQSFNVSVLPRTILVSRRGEILYDHLGFDKSKAEEIENEIISKL